MDPLLGILRTIWKALEDTWRLEFLFIPLPPSPLTPAVRQSFFIFYVLHSMQKTTLSPLKMIWPGQQKYQ